MLQPMLATPAPGRSGLPSGPAWAYEIKWDGVRALADTTAGGLRLWSRNGNDVTVAYPELSGLAAVPDAVLTRLGDLLAPLPTIPAPKK